MGNSDSQPAPSMEDVLIHAFKLDADFNICSIPFICPRKQAMFHVPSALSDHLEHFFPLKEVKTVIEDLNNILTATGFNPRPSNPLFLISMLFMFIISMSGVMGSVVNFDESSNVGVSIAVPFIVGFLPFICFFLFSYYMRKKRERDLMGYINQWNRNDRGVKLTLGGFVNNPRTGLGTGTEQGGGYFHFYCATWDPKGLVATGYLNVFINMAQRQEWCRINRVPFVMPLPQNQQTMAQNQPLMVTSPNPQAVAPPQGYQAPAGYVLVPQSQVQVPPGFALVPQDQVNLNMATAPQNQDLPPTYDQSKNYGVI